LLATWDFSKITIPKLLLQVFVNLGSKAMFMSMCRLSLLALGLQGLAATAADNSLNYPQTAKCCDKIDNENDMMTCLEKVDFGTKDIAILSYASTDIMEYAAYSFGVNSAYAEHNGYEMYFLNEAGGSNYEPRDPR
jgi:hypothetical protein